MTPLLFALAAATGAVGRAAAAGIARGSEWATAAVNVGGSFLLGVLVGMARAGDLDTGTLTILGAGLCGSLTTFSTYAVQVAEHPRRLAGYAALSVVASIAAGAAGLALV